MAAPPKSASPPQTKPQRGSPGNSDSELSDDELLPPAAGPSLPPALQAGPSLGAGEISLEDLVGRLTVGSKVKSYYVRPGGAISSKEESGTVSKIGEDGKLEIKFKNAFVGMKRGIPAGCVREIEDGSDAGPQSASPPMLRVGYYALREVQDQFETDKKTEAAARAAVPPPPMAPAPKKKKKGYIPVHEKERRAREKKKLAKRNMKLKSNQMTNTQTSYIKRYNRAGTGDQSSREVQEWNKNIVRRRMETNVNEEMDYGRTDDFYAKNPVYSVTDLM